MDPEQTAPTGPKCLPESMLMLNRHFQMQLLGLINVFCIYTEVMGQDDTVTFE